MIFGPKASRPCSASNRPSHTPTSPVALEVYQKALDHIAGSSQLGTNALQYPEFYEDRGGDFQRVGPGICITWVTRWQSGRAELRKMAREMLSDLFGLS